MSDSEGFGFGKFVPGFDFLQNLTKQAASSTAGAIPQLPNLSSWVAPTLNVEELEKRIEELKAVHFWLEQNSKVLGATIQALEVQKMTLATLKGMNFNFGDVANAFKLKAGEAVGNSLLGGAAQKVADKAGDAAKSALGAASSVASGVASVASGAASGAAAGAVKAVANKRRTAAKSAAATGVVDPMQWWGALTQQFQGIAASAMKDAARNTAIDTTRNLATGMAKEAVKGAASMAKAATKNIAGSAAPKRAAAKKAPRKTVKTAARKRSG